jgi:dihydrofolate synthase / folylpolyglutamate synthase
MKLQKIVNRLQKLHPKEIDLSLDRVKNLCTKLGNPQDKIKAISIIGTLQSMNLKETIYPT